MKIVHREHNSDPANWINELPLDKYIENIAIRDGDADGLIEKLREKIESQSRLIGTLVDILADKGLIVEDDVLRLNDDEYWERYKGDIKLIK